MSAPAPGKDVVGTITTQLPGLPGTDGGPELMRAPDGTVREVVRIHARIEHVPSVVAQPCVCGAEHTSPDREMVAAVCKGDELPPIECYRCKRIIVITGSLVDQPSSGGIVSGEGRRSI